MRTQHGTMSNHHNEVFVEHRQRVRWLRPDITGFKPLWNMSVYTFTFGSFSVLFNRITSKLMTVTSGAMQEPSLVSELKTIYDRGHGDPNKETQM